MANGRGHKEEANRLGLALVGASLLVAAVVATSMADRSALGAPGYWTWILTGLQVIALRAAATGSPGGWLLGATVQLPWIAYALVTAQFGFIPGCLVSGVVQAHGYLQGQIPRPQLERPTYA